MKTKILFYGFWLMMPMLGRAQQSTTSSGGIFSSSTGSMSVVVGQFNYERQGSQSSITGGVLQVYPLRNLEKPFLASALHVWPNPTSDLIMVSLDDQTDQPFSCQIFDLSGQKIAEQALDLEHMQIDLRDFRTGTYLLIFQVPNQNPVPFKIIKL